jgi:hypothetical protein
MATRANTNEIQSVLRSVQEQLQAVGSSTTAQISALAQVVEKALLGQQVQEKTGGKQKADASHPVQVELRRLLGEKRYMSATEATKAINAAFKGTELGKEVHRAGVHYHVAAMARRGELHEHIRRINGVKHLYLIHPDHIALPWQNDRKDMN